MVKKITQLDKSHQRVGVFIDTQNLYHSARSMFSSRVNYPAIMDAALRGRQLVRAFAYVIKSGQGDESKFFDALKELGIEPRIKDLQIFYGGEKKADWDVGISIDIVRMVQKLDVVVLVSGDGDFAEVLKYVKSNGVRAEVIAMTGSVSSILLDETDHFIDLAKDEKRFLYPIKS